MVSFKNGILRIEQDREGGIRLLYDISFVLNAVTLFAFYDVRMIGTITGILMLVVAAFIWIGRRNRKIVVPYNTVWYGLFTAFCAMSGIWSDYINAGMASYVLRMVVIVAMITSISIYVDTPEDLERIIKLFMTSMLIIVLLEFSCVPFEEWSNGSMGSHFSGSNPNGIAFLVFCAELMAFYEFYSKNKKSYLLLVALFVLFIVLSSSRKAMFAALAGPMLFVVMSTYKKNYFLNIITSLSLVVIVFMFIMTDENAYNAIGKRIDSMFDFVLDDRSTRIDNSLYMRTYYIELAKEIFAESPIVGKGIGNFARIIDEVYMLKGVYSHNNFWQILSELGIVGFAIYYSMYFYMIVKLAKSAYIDKSRISLLFLVFMIMLVVLESGLVTYQSKMPHVVIAIAYTATYVGEMDGRKYKYIENNGNR